MRKVERPVWCRVTEYVLAFLALTIFWQLLAWVLSKPVLPPPLVAIKALVEGLSGELKVHLMVSAYRILASLAWATLVAVPLGLLIGRIYHLDRLVAPLIYLVYPVPKVVFLPVVLVLMGLGDISKIFLIGLIAFFQILVATRDAARGVEKELVYSLRSLGATQVHIFRHVVFPAALPKIITSLRIALGTSIAVLFITETVATSTGIGYYLMDAWARVAYDDLFAGVLAMGLMGFGLYLLLDWLEKRICPWQHL